MNNFIETRLADHYRGLLFMHDVSAQAIFGFECNDGWADLIEGSLRLIQRRVELDALDVKISQAKEKFGQLRIHHRGGDEDVDSVFEIAQLASACICELCGTPGEIMSVDGWLVARCAKHFRRDHVHQIESHQADESYIASYMQAVGLILSFFGAGAVLWAQQQSIAFAGRRPCELLATVEGCQAIYLLLKRLEHGVGI